METCKKPILIFIIGESGTGKSTLAYKLSKVGIATIRTSGWITNLVDTTDLSSSERTKVLTSKSIEYLNKDADIAFKWIKLQIDSQINCDRLIIEGIRNPSDFVKLFDYKSDLVIHLTHKYINNEPTIFESYGLKTILSYLTFVTETNLRNKIIWEKYKYLSDDIHPNAVLL